MDDASLITQATDFARAYMARYDSSHDFGHIRRVVACAHKIYAAQITSSNAAALDHTIITLACLLHDVGDHKYAEADEEPEPVKSFLISAGAAPALASKVQRIVAHVSYSNEIRNPSEVARVLAECPELAIVQDSDRLDAIGAVGVGRCFTYSSSVAAKKQAKARANGMVNGGTRGTNSMDDSLQHFDDKLLHLKDMMKTPQGRAMAEERTQRIRMFQQWWREETFQDMNLST